MENCFAGAVFIHSCKLNLILKNFVARFRFLLLGFEEGPTKGREEPVHLT